MKEQIKREGRTLKLAWVKKRKKKREKKKKRIRSRKKWRMQDEKWEGRKIKLLKRQK